MHILRSKVKLFFKLNTLLNSLLLYLLLLYSVRIVVMNSMVADVVQVNWRILIQTLYDFRSSDSTVDDLLPMPFEFVENIKRNHERPKYPEEDEEIIHSQLSSLNLTHYRIFSVLAYLVSPQNL